MSFDSCVFEARDIGGFRTQLYEACHSIVVDFEILCDGHRCIFKNGMDNKLARIICERLYNLIQARVPGVTVEYKQHVYFIINNVYYTLYIDQQRVCHLQQLLNMPHGRIAPCLVIGGALCFQINLDVTGEDFDHSVVNKSSTVPLLTQQQRAEQIIDLCYNRVCGDDTSDDDNIMDINDVQRLCTLQYQLLWDIIDSYEYDDDPAVADEQRAQVLFMALKIDRRGVDPEKLTDFFQKASLKGCLHAAALHVVRECKRCYSSFYATVRANGLPKECIFYQGSRTLDFKDPVVQKFLLNLRGNVLDTLEPDSPKQDVIE